LIGIEPEDMDWGTRPTAAVAAALPKAAAHAHKLVRNWRTENSSEAHQ
jgi:hypothetical protein